MNTRLLALLAMILTVGAVALILLARRPSRAEFTLPEATKESAEALRWGELIARLQDLRNDYGEANEEGSEEAYESALQLAKAASAYAQTLGPEAEYLLPILGEIERMVGARDQPHPVTRACEHLLHQLYGGGKVATFPTRHPDLTRGGAIYAANCSGCHGRDGNPLEVEAVKGLKPFPTSFMDPTNINPLSPFRAYMAVTHGIAGTAMPPFSALSPDDRWNVAFFVFSLRHPVCTPSVALPPLSELSMADDNHLEATHGETAMPCLRRLQGTPLSSR